MKRLLFIGFISLIGVKAMAQSTESKTYGAGFQLATAPTAAEDLSKKMGDKTALENVYVRGIIAQVCQAEGCWLKLKNEKGENIMVKFKDHAFLVPKDISGKSITVHGKAIKKSVSVAEQKHLAEDAGSTEQELAAIQSPKEELRIEATGVVVD